MWAQMEESQYIYIYTYTYLYIELHGFWTWVLKAMVLVENDPSTSINGWERARTKGRAIVERQLGEAQAAGELMCAAFPFGSWGVFCGFFHDFPSLSSFNLSNSEQIASLVGPFSVSD